MTSSSRDKLYSISCVWFIICLGVSVLLFISGMTLQLLQSDTEYTLLLSPMDTRLLSFKQDTCLDLSISTVSHLYTVRLILLLEYPETLFADHIISFDETSSVLSHSVFNYHLINGSEIQTIYGFTSYSNDDDSAVMQFTVATSKEYIANFQKFQFAPKFSQLCMKPRCRAKYTIPKQDDYYFIYAVNTGRIGNLHVELDIQRMLYIVDTMHYSNCTAPCSLSVPSHPKMHAVIESSLPYSASEYRWRDRIQVTWSCSGQYSFISKILVIIGSVLCTISYCVFPAICYVSYAIAKNAPKEQLNQTNSAILSVSATAPPTELAEPEIPSSTMHHHPVHPTAPVSTTQYCSYTIHHPHNIGNDNAVDSTVLTGRIVQGAVLPENTSRDDVLPPPYEVVVSDYSRDNA